MVGVVARTKISKQHQTTVPKAIINFLELEPGDRVTWSIESSKVVVTREESSGDSSLVRKVAHAQ